MKKGWQTKTIGDVCEFQRGLTYAKGDEVDVSDNVVLRATNIDLATNLLIFDELKYISEKVVVPESKKVKKGSLMICMASGSKSHLGKVAFIDDDYGYAFGGFMGMLTPVNGLWPKYLFHLMTSEDYKDFIGALSDGANINNLTFDKLKVFPVPVPPLAEQQRIVGLLDEAFEGLATAKANAEKNLQNARALFESHLQSVFTQRGPGWVENTLGEICDFSQGVQVDVKLQSDIRKDQSQVRFLRIIDFTQGNDPERFIDNPGEKFLVCQSDISLVRYGASTGFVCRGLEGAIANNLFRVIPKDGHVSKDFLYWFLKSPAFQDEIKEIMNGAAMPAISFGVINEICIAFLPQRDQLAIVNKLELFAEESQRLAHIYERKLAALAELKKSLLHQAFTGEL